MLQQEQEGEPSVNVKVEIIEGKQFIRCSDCNSPRPVYDTVKIPEALRNKIKQINKRIDFLKDRMPNRQDILNLHLQDLMLIEREIREAERTQLLRAVPLYRSPADKSKLICGECFDNIYNFNYTPHGERKIK